MNLPPGSRPTADSTAEAAPLLAVTKRLVGPDRALEAARVITAFAHGFVSMELAERFAWVVTLTRRTATGSAS